MKFDKFFYKSYIYFYHSEQKRWKKWTMNGIFFSLFTLLSFLIGFDPTKSITMMFFSMLFITLIILIISTKIFKGSFKITRKLPNEGYIGTPLSYKVVIENLSSYGHNGLIFLEEEYIDFPTFNEFLTYPEPQEEKRNRWDRGVKYYRWIWMLKYRKKVEIKESQIPKIDKLKKIEVNLSLVPKNRGEVILSKCSIIYPDIFGIFRSFISINAVNSFFILPKKYNVSNFRLNSRVSSSYTGEFISPEIGDGDEFYSLREYKDGDSWRNIDWKSWAKTGKPVIKEYQKGGVSKNMIILDSFDDGFGEKFEEVISLGYSFWTNERFKFSKIYISDKVLEKSKKKEGETQFFSLAKVEREDSFEKYINIWSKNILSFSTIFYITPFIDPKREQEIKKLSSKGVSISIFLIVSKLPKNRKESIKYLTVGNIERDL